MTPSGIEHATFWLVANCTQLRHRVTPHPRVLNVNLYEKISLINSVNSDM